MRTRSRCPDRGDRRPPGLVDLRASKLDGRQAEDRLHKIGITVNRNAVPFDSRPPMVSSGLRIGTSALATRGVQLDDYRAIGQIIAEALTVADFEASAVKLSQSVAEIVARYPLYARIG